MGKTLADLQSNISISAENAVTGDIEFCSGYTGFSDDASEQSGWYLALKVSPSVEETALEGATITATYGGTVRTLADGETFIVRLAKGEDSITFTANKEGYTEGRLTLDLSGLTLEEDPTMKPYLDFVDTITYNENTYSLSDFISVVGSFERTSPTETSSYGKQNLILRGTTFKRVSLDGGATYGYYLPYTSVANCVFKTSAGLQPIVSAYMLGDYGIIKMFPPFGPEPSSVPSSGLIQISDVWADKVVGSINIKYQTGPDTTSSTQKSLTIENCIFENKGEDPRNSVNVEYPTNFVYNNITYNTSDFVTGGTITRQSNSNNITITGATFKWNPLQGETTYAYYLPLIWTGNGWVFLRDNPKQAGMISGIRARGGQYDDIAPFITGTGSDAFVYRIRNTGTQVYKQALDLWYTRYYPNGQNAVNARLLLSNCTFEPAPT